MKMKVRFYSVFTALVMGLAGLEFAQGASPPNDNFANRIVLG